MRILPSGGNVWIAPQRASSAVPRSFKCGDVQIPLLVFLSPRYRGWMRSLSQFVSAALFGACVVNVVLVPACKRNTISIAPNNDYVSSVIGPKGGRLDGPDGSSVEFVAGALTNDVTIRMGRVDDISASPLPAG